MRPIQPPPGIAGVSRSSRPGRRRDLTLPLPQRDPTALAVPLPLPPSSNTAPPSTSHQNGSNSGGLPYPLDFSHLERVNRIGSGAGGTVYKVIHRPSGRLYALKVMYGHHEESVRDQILREIKILRDVDDPNVVKCYDIYNHNGEIQVLLELMDGGSLEGRHIPNEHQLSKLTYQILSGIAYLHRKKIVHRDIKPSNLLVNSKNKVKIADFGVGRVLAQTMDPCSSSVGTIAYMSPERINTDLNHGMYDGYAGDIWSFGVSILEFYLGRFPFAVGRQGDWASLMIAICMSEPPEAPPTASNDFRDFIACCLQREPARRWIAARLLNHPFILQHNQQPVEKAFASASASSPSPSFLPSSLLLKSAQQPTPTSLSLSQLSSFFILCNRRKCSSEKDSVAGDRQTCRGKKVVERAKVTGGGLAGLRTIAVRIAGGGKRGKKAGPRKRPVKVVKDKLMDWWHRMVFPVRRLWFVVSSTRVKFRKQGAGILKLRDDVQTCGYEDVQVMWEMLRRSETEIVASSRGKRKQLRPFWRVSVWSGHNSEP